MGEVVGLGVGVNEDEDELAALYRALAGRLRQIVGARVHAPDPVIEDACQLAWIRLIRHRAHVRRETALGWLATTAMREAFRLLRHDRRVVSLDDLAEGPATPVAPSVDELAEQRARLDTIGGLPERQQRLVWLQGLGLSYSEMAGYTGVTPRTVERQLLRAKRALREAA
ncbi:MAG TPA: sigma-70 family RNA polymerase sigma factor [Solirubrobacteraceae bacterium]|jgi:RNA polymerase sigma factor (sigma-70 family)